MTAIILAGAKKSLSSELYPDTPIPLIPVADQPFLYWLTQWIKSQGYRHIIFSAGIHTDKVSAWVADQSATSSDVLFDVIGEERPLGTAGAALKAAKRFPAKHYLIVNGDSLVLNDMQGPLQSLQSEPELDGVILAVRMPNAGRFGQIVADQNNQLIAFNEKQPGEGLINAGVYLLKQSLLDTLEDNKELSLEYDCFPTWLKEGKRIKVEVTDVPFIDVDTPESLSKAEDLIAPYREQLENIAC